MMKTEDRPFILRDLKLNTLSKSSYHIISYELSMANDRIISGFFLIPRMRQAVSFFTAEKGYFSNYGLRNSL